jgi:hypothetical protein
MALPFDTFTADGFSASACLLIAPWIRSLALKISVE